MENQSIEKRLVIEAGRGEAHYWRDVRRYHELFYFLAWRDILVRYKQTVVGIAWSVLRPLIAMIIFTIVFGRIARFPSSGVPYPILVLTGLLPWQFFASVLGETSFSLVSNSNMLSKVYFPRLIIPASTLIVNLVDFSISLILLACLMAWYQVVPGWQIAALPIFLALAMFSSFGLGILFAALNVKFRDFRYIIPVIIQSGFFISPVGYSSTMVPEKWRLLYSLNPMVGVIDGFRWVFLGTHSQLYLPAFFISVGYTMVTLWVGLKYFRKMERTFADVI